MLSANEIKNLFKKLNKKLEKAGDKGEIALVGGTVMCLVFNARNATRDVEAIFEPSELLRKLAKELAEEEDLNSEWLNDAAKVFLQNNFEKQEVMNLSHLRVWAPTADYMLAMKCISARWDTNDREDVIFLIKQLNIKTAKEVFSIIENYYPKKQIPEKSQFLIEEIFENLK